MRALLTLTLWLVSAPPLAAQQSGDCNDTATALPSPELMRTLTQWIGAHTDYDITRSLRTPPSVSFCMTGETIRYEGHDLLVDPELRAAYDLSARRIFLVRPWQADNPNDVSALLHELIHDVQPLNRDWPCIGAPEWEAYSLQEQWLQARGIDPGFDWMSIYMWSRCPRDVHPD